MSDDVVGALGQHKLLILRADMRGTASVMLERRPHGLNGLDA